MFLTKLGPTLSLALTETVAPNPVGVGNNVTFTYKITNNGDLTTGIIFTDVIPSNGATFVSANSVSRPVELSRSGDQQHRDLHGRNIERWSGRDRDRGAGSHAACHPVQPGSVSDGGRVSIFGTSTVVTPAPPPAVAVVNDFSVAVSPPTATVPAGIPASFTVTVTPTGNIPEHGDACPLQARPQAAQTTFPNGTSFTNLSSGAAEPPAGGQHHGARDHSGQPLPHRRAFLCRAIPGFRIGAAGRRHRRQEVATAARADAALLGCFFALVVFQLGCGSSSTTSTTTGTPAGTYNLTVTATSGSATRTQQIVLVVQ